MKKVFFCAVVLFLVAGVAVFAERAQIDEALAAYEAVAVEAEKLAAMPLFAAADFTALDQKATEAQGKISAVATEREWMISDAKKSADLRARFNQAMATVIGNLLKY